MSNNSKGLHALEIDCLARRMLGDLSEYLTRREISDFKNRESVRWLGVFARDQLPDDLNSRRPFALVLNTDPADKPGMHWLAMYGPAKGPIELFDSYALPPSLYALNTFALTYSRTPLQSPTSAVCGHYCLYFLYIRSHGHSFNTIIRHLKQMFNVDSYVQKFINDLQARFRSILPCNRTGQCCQLKCSFC
jgi:hypothetical protein